MRSTSVRVPLYVKFLGWAGLNVVLIALCLYAYAPHDESGLNLLLTQSVRDRLGAIARDTAGDLYGVDPSAWAPILARHSTISEVKLSARDTPGPFDKGLRPPTSRAALPFEDAGPHGGLDGKGPRVLDGGPPGAPDFGPPGARSRPARGGGPPPEINIRRHRDQPGYQVSIFVEVVYRGGPPHGYVVTADADNLRALLDLLGVDDELRFGLVLLLLSALLWWPFIWRITRTIGQLSNATLSVSRGLLDTRVTVSSRDELGDLAASINSMAERLELLVGGQRQFVADVAHEVISPVARMQIGLGILEGRVEESAAGFLKDVREDLEGMAGMLNELLLFSRSGMEAVRSAPASVELRPLMEKIVASESDGAPVSIDVPAELSVHVHAALLSRALANLIRNARRYGGAGPEPVEVSAKAEGERVQIAVRDRGPGVPADAITRLGEPFFRPELARSRATGGYGLGLAIVKRCILTCDGDVSFGNRDGGGFVAQISVPAAPGPIESPG